LDEKRKANLEALGFEVQSIAPELAEKWGTSMSPGKRPVKSNPDTQQKEPNSQLSSNTRPAEKEDWEEFERNDKKLADTLAKYNPPTQSE